MKNMGFGKRVWWRILSRKENTDKTAKSSVNVACNITNIRAGDSEKRDPKVMAALVITVYDEVYSEPMRTKVHKVACKITAYSRQEKPKRK
jgi:hypothetical protein